MLRIVFFFVAVVLMSLSFGQPHKNEAFLKNEIAVIQNNDSVALLSVDLQEKNASQSRMKKTIIIGGFIVLVIIGGVLSLYYAH